MADVLNPEQTESTHLNTELETPTLDAPADHFDPSEEPTPHAGTPSLPHRSSASRPSASADETELTGMEDFAAALESFDREQAAEAAAAQSYDDNLVTGTVIKLTDKHVVVDVGLKSEGLIPLEQVLDHTGQPKLRPGDTVEVVVEREEAEGGFLLSYDKAQRHRV
jgi:small subunit ribosomal protein S1